MIITKSKPFSQGKKKSLRKLCDSSTVNCLVPSITSLQRRNAKCCLLCLLCEGANDCGSKMQRVFPEERIPFCSEGYVAAEGMYVPLLSCVQFSFLLSCFLTEAKLKVTHTNWLLLVRQIFLILKFSYEMKWESHSSLLLCSSHYSLLRSNGFLLGNDHI